MTIFTSTNFKHSKRNFLLVAAMHPFAYNSNDSFDTTNYEHSKRHFLPGRLLGRSNSSFLLQFCNDSINTTNLEHSEGNFLVATIYPFLCNCRCDKSSPLQITSFNNQRKTALASQPSMLLHISHVLYWFCTLWVLSLISLLMRTSKV